MELQHQIPPYLIFPVCVFRTLHALLWLLWCLTLVLMCTLRATVSAVSCLVVPAFICIDLLISCALKINDDNYHHHHHHFQ